MLKAIVFSYILLFVLASPLIAKNSGSGSSSSTPTFQQRINRGEKDGSLIEAEAKLLNQKQNQLRNYREKINKDGEVTAEEAAKLKELRDAQRKRIRDERNDAQMQHEERFSNFITRIQNGVKEGHLTQAEGIALTQELERAQEYYKASIRDDGKLDKAERERLGNIMNPLHKEIREEREDAQRIPVGRELSGEFFCGNLNEEECLELQELQAKHRESLKK